MSRDFNGPETGEKAEDFMAEPAQPLRSEPRWPVVLSILGALAILAVLPARLRVFPVSLPLIIALVGIVPMAAVALTAGSPRWLRVERVTTLLLFALAEGGTLAGLASLIAAMISRPVEITGLQLLTSSIGVWVTNMLSFALLYWQVDRGGPGGRMRNPDARPHWSFPEEGAPKGISPDWRPAFAEYLFMGYSTSTTFSAGYGLPLTARAKLLMMCQGGLSLVTTVTVASRAINILGS